MKKSNNQKGITLVALVVTIIVLLILAAVSLSLVAGSDGLLNRASNAVDKTIEASAKEQAELLAVNYKAEFYDEKYVQHNNNLTNAGAYLASQTASGQTAGGYYIQSSGTSISVYKDSNKNVTYASGTILENGSINWGGTAPSVNPGNEDPGEEPETIYTITYSAGGGEGSMENTTVAAGNSVNLRTNTFEKEGYTFSGWSDGTNSYTDGQSVTPEGNLALTAQWTVAADPTDPIGEARHTGDYGKIVTGYTGYSAYDEGDVWRLFYADTNNAYLIKNTIGNKALNDSTLFSDYSTASGETISTLGKNLNTSCLDAFWTTNPSYNNKKGTAVLTNSDNFANYKNSYANWAIGGPSLEMFIASYNETHTAEAIAAYKANGHSSETLTETQLDCDVESTSATGYKVKKGSEALNYYTTGLGNTSALDQGIYCPSSGIWWLASPSASDISNVMRVGSSNSGTLNGNTYGGSYGVRPLVSISVSKIGNGITVTNNY